MRAGLRSDWRRLAVAACLAAMPIGGAALAEAPALPPLMSPASQEHHPGKDVFVMLVTPDMAGAKAFYAGLFGWQFRDVPGMRFPYAAAYLGSQMVGGIVQRDPPAGQQRQPAWLGYFSVPDVAGAVAKTTSQGAKVLAAPLVLPGFGTRAVLADPQGAVFGVLASASGDPPDVLKPVGAWIWRSVVSGDPAAEAAFYHSVLGFQSMALPAAGPGDGQHLLLVSENYARATVNAFPAGRPATHPHWLNYVRVEDAGQAVARATALGGHVLLAPRPDRHGGMIAIVADPQGAPVGLLEWGDDAHKEITK